MPNSLSGTFPEELFRSEQGRSDRVEWGSLGGGAAGIVRMQLCRPCPRHISLPVNHGERGLLETESAGYTVLLEQEAGERQTRAGEDQKACGQG
jgi:hypothetical protein